MEHKARLSTEHSPFYKIWVLTNLAAKPFAAMFGERLHLNLTEWRVLLTVADRPDMVAQDLSDLTGLDKMTVSRAVRQLERQGRLKREGSASDRRKRHLYLTEDGWTVYEEIAASGAAREAQLYATLTPQEMQVLQSVLAKLLAQARQPAP